MQTLCQCKLTWLEGYCYDCKHWRCVTPKVSSVVELDELELKELYSKADVIYKSISLIRNKQVWKNIKL